MRTMPALATLLLVLGGSSPVLGQDSIRLDMDATDLPRSLLRATETIPLGPDLTRSGGDLALWYPKWVPGSHAPGGPIQNIGGLVLTDQDGRSVAWTRTPGEVYRIVAHVPKGARSLRIDLRYIANQSDENSHGLDTYGSDLIGLISPNTVLLYPDGADARRTMVRASLRVPEGWKAATALALDDDTPDDATFEYGAVSMETLVDSPIMLGAHEKTYELSGPGIDSGTGMDMPPQRLHVFSEAESAVRIHEDVVKGYRAMASECALLFGSFPFDSFDILLGVSDVLERNGLEHLRSTMNVLPLTTLRSPDSLKGWDRMLIPHEYIHSWCGKYRRPTGMATHDFNTPKATELLWVYEGLTQYLGNVVEARSGLMDTDDFRWMMLERIRSARFQQGRQWRPLADTAAASHTLRAHSPNWSHLRRGQDYYYEGALIWMEADALIRKGTDGAKSLDDFCRVFFAHEDGDPIPKPYDRDEVVRTLGSVFEHDWDAFLAERVDRAQERPILDLVPLLGYRIEYVSEPPTGPGDESINELDARDSLGMRVGSSGQVGSVQLGSPADRAGIGPGMKIAGVDGFVFSTERFTDALERTPVTGRMELMLISGDTFVTKQIEYDGGPRYMTLVRDESQPDLLEDIGRARRSE